jgi:phosphatidylglycerophosphatase A
MKTTIEKRKPDGALDYIALAATTFGVGYLPIMPGTYGSAVGVLIYLTISFIAAVGPESSAALTQPAWAWLHVAVLVSFLLFCLLGIWSAGRSTELLGNSDPSEAVVDEVIGQLITFLFVPFGISWPFVVAGFFLFRLFDIWKPYPIDYLQVLPGGIGVCADDILAGVYAGVCLSVIYAVSLSI